ncbi:MAG: hypothetical protein DWB42_14260 [Chloroflexi bacterium]|nr:hypothetical protein [Chloroflexota bacterium]
MLPADAGQNSKKPAGKLKSVDALFPFWDAPRFHLRCRFRHQWFISRLKSWFTPLASDNNTD